MKSDKRAFYAGMLAALVVVAQHDAATIFREIVATADEQELVAAARADDALEWSGLAKYGYGTKATIAP